MRHHKVYVTLGFHVNCYHSWRGDTPDEAGFGADIRIIRAIIRMLNDANRRGLQARGYWDWEVYFSVQKILPQYAPDILADIRARVQAGQDEIVLGPYNNGANHAATEEELRAAVAYAIRNPFGSGLEQVFGHVAPIYRPQEMMLTPGQLAILRQEGVQALILLYASVPFNTLSNFVPTLPVAQRYNPLWFRMTDDEAPMVVLPCISAGDIIEHVSLEALLLKLRRLQVRGELNHDVLVHLNEDADLESWLPIYAPRALAWFPNLGGLEEYIRAVNKYPWAEFTTPFEYLATHPPLAEILVRPDLADGGFDGSYSWAEKYTSLKNWTLVEQSRLATYRAMGGMIDLRGFRNLEGLRARLWEGEDSAFFQRMIGLTTTHFGMSTPVINEERQVKAEAMLGRAQQIAIEAEREVARATVAALTSLPPPPSASQQPTGEGEVLYTLCVSAPLHSQQAHATNALLRAPLILPAGVASLAVTDATGAALPASLVDVRPLPDGRRSGELLIPLDLEAGKRRAIIVRPSDRTEVLTNQPTNHLHNAWLDVYFSAANGIEALTFCGEPIGGGDFLRPFITFRDSHVPHVPGTSEVPGTSSGYTFLSLTDETWDGAARVRIETTIPLHAAEGTYTNRLRYTFNLFDHLPYLFVDVEVEYAATRKRDLIQSFVQKLRRWIDRRWIEVAPFQLHPQISAPPAEPLRVWKHNHLGITSYYDLDYGKINPVNRNLDSFNHQATAGWVAVSNRAKGLLLAESTDALASMAFCPMRLREVDGVQQLWLNPFGTYHGKQPDYRHVGHHGVGAAITEAVSGSLRPNAPSFNGQTLRFSLMLAPYLGHQPPAEVQADAAAFFYPLGLIYAQTPAGMTALLAEDVRSEIGRIEAEAQMASDAPLAAPQSLLANPSQASLDLVWDAPTDGRVTGYELRWKPADAADWQTLSLPPGDRWHLDGLQDGKRYLFQLRALAPRAASPWTEMVEGVPGAVSGKAGLGMLRGVPARVIARMVLDSVIEVLRGRFSAADLA